MPLTDAKIRSAKPQPKPYDLPDGGSLALEVRPTGAKLWRYRYRIAGKENMFAIGEYYNDKRAGHVSLEEARRSRDSARILIKQGIHPSHQRRTERMAQEAAATNTFEGVALEWVDKKKSGWSAYYTQQVQHFLEADAFPHIGNLPIRSVTAAHLLALLKRVEERGAETIAMLGRQWCSAIFRYAVVTLRADHDPAAALKGALTKPKTVHAKALSREELATLNKVLDDYTGERMTVIGLRLMQLTFVRTKELRQAEWSEIDFARAEWRIPAPRMKKREPHIVPLADQSIALLRELHALTGGQRWLFPNRRRPKDCMCATTLNRALERMGFNGKKGIGFSAHGFRATASTFLNEFGYREDWIETQLSHTDRDKSRSSYNHALYLLDRRKMMVDWAAIIDGISRGKVVPLRASAG